MRSPLGERLSVEIQARQRLARIYTRWLSTKVVQTIRTQDFNPRCCYFQRKAAGKSEERKGVLANYED